jgi:hypothetical protein
MASTFSFLRRKDPSKSQLNSELTTLVDSSANPLRIDVGAAGRIRTSEPLWERILSPSPLVTIF